MFMNSSWSIANCLRRFANLVENFFLQSTVPDINWHTLTGLSTVSMRLCDLTFDHNLAQLINQPTHICGNILDLALTNGNDKISLLKVHSQFLDQLSTDHYMIIFIIEVKRQSVKNKNLNFSKVNVDLLQFSLINSNLLTCYNMEVICKNSIVGSMHQSISKVKVSNCLITLLPYGLQANLDIKLNAQEPY